MNTAFKTKNQYDSIVGAKLLLALAHQKGIVLNTTKVQKMLYIIYSYFLAKHGYEIFTETPKAWPYGPVFPRTRKNVDYSKVYKTSDTELENIIKEKDIVEKFNSVIDKYARFSASHLSNWSHMEAGPWDKTTKQPQFKWGDYIPSEYIKDYFSNLEV
ncbi:hypothetical protein ATE47_04235 [Chryseobacterium sp. IHB B 17019]|uniref:Panacea domain-containing protein n=1 Tax=Chryseobacterium sp. IHB B 17019 TaxID=1721091 RepID=UPI00072059B9|nr:type II toxin-antitoxin system antitoxin SocA domain-containing protein [Chryseobacterium sp. IHB B 17019]ALR29778.1 hypothetical protein ATE47_04235 [Chryseobacterium sp. IHB B 17019]